MGNRSSRTRVEDQLADDLASAPGPPVGPPRPQVYAQYPTSQPQRPPQSAPYYPPVSNGQYYGGWHQPPYPPQHFPPPHQQPAPNHPGAPRPYPHAPPSGRMQPTPPQRPPAPAPTQELAQTATIRNAVNLKKPTLKVTPIPGDPTKLAITFTFDASAPCVASTFVAATEEPGAGSKLTPVAQQPAPAVRFPRGMGLTFPGADASKDVAARHIIDLSRYQSDPGVLQSARGDTYPLIVRLEVITERGAKEGHSLTELVPGGEQKPWVQSQTTFAALHKEEDGSWTVRVLKQKIWVEGVSYELQEIYGLENAGGGGGSATGADGASTAEDAEERLCVICLVSPRDTTVLPCRHMCMCHECAGELRKQSSKCPICRNHVESLLHIRITKKEKDIKVAAGQGGSATSGGTGVAEEPRDEFFLAPGELSATIARAGGAAAPLAGARRPTA